MTLRAGIEGLFEMQVTQLAASREFRALESGSTPPADYDRFLGDVVRTHLRATEFVAFLCALAPPATSESRLRNLLEELHHPGLLRQLAAGAGLGDRLPELEALAAADVRRLVVEPVLYRTLGEVGLAAFCEDEDGLAIAELTLRENVFLRRYFRDGTLAGVEGTPCGS